MEARKGGSSTPSYRQAVASRGKKPIKSVRGPSGEGKRNMEEDQDSTKPREENSTKENEEETRNMEQKTRRARGHVNPRLRSFPEVF